MDISNKKINFHIHTKYSFDSNLEPTFIVDLLASNGYDIAIITDHNTIKGAIEAQNYAKKKYGNKFEVIVGEEVQSDIGDIIGFPVHDEVEPGDYKTVINELKKQGAKLCLPHPYKSHNLFIIHDDNFICNFDFIEVFNARVPIRLDTFAEELRTKFKKKGIIGTDAHVKNDLLNCAFVYDNDLNHINVQAKKTSIRNIRKSQLINSSRQIKLGGICKYTFLYAINK